MDTVKRDFKLHVSAEGVAGYIEAERKSLDTVTTRIVVDGKVVEEWEGNRDDFDHVSEMTGEDAASCAMTAIFNSWRIL